MERRGTIKLSMELFESSEINWLHDLFAWLKFIPLRCECRYDRDEFEMTGISPHFEPVEQKYYPPVYSVTVTDTGDGLVYSVTKGQ